MLKNAAKLNSGSMVPGKVSAGTITRSQLVEIAKAHFPAQAKAYATMFAKVAERVVKMRGDTKDGSPAPP